MADTSSRELKIGTVAAFGAYVMWGLFPIYWKRLSGVESLQILCHRIVWAAVFTLVALLVTRKLGSLAALFRDRRRLVSATAASVLITINWGTYIWAVNSDHVTESSLGYYINPLVSVALGAIFFRERMDTWTSWAVGLAAAGVAVASILMGNVPWISLVLATSFGFYGLVKKKAGLEPLVGLAAETLIASPFALAFLVARHSAGLGSFGGSDTVATVMLFLAGIVTAIPLLCFAAAANRITLTRMGFIQYVSPTIQLALGLLAFGESLTFPMIAAFAAVIAAVALYAFTRNRAVPRASKVKNQA
ncbi:MAG: EamA family transporter RarD [Rectinemataceae bacterium]|jgi:chloramphenicol-sensitive protein RarD